MNIYIADFEVTRYDWLFVAKSVDTGKYTVVHNQNDVLAAFMERSDPVLGFFNAKGYDQWILKAVLMNYTPEEVKEVNDKIIGGISGWDIPEMRNAPRFNHFDLMDDCQQGLSLKAIEAHLGMDITETTVAFDIDRQWSKEELDRMIYYCKADVDATEKLYHLRKNYLDGKVKVGKMKGLSPERSMYMTNARLTAEFLGATRREYDDERKYVIPDNLLREYVPQEVFDHFAKMYDSSIPDEELFKMKTQIRIGDTEVTVGYGGVHAGIPNYQYRRCGNGRTLRNYDVSSYYPSLMIQNGYSSRSIPSFKVFEDVYHDRIAAKKSGNKELANTLKLVLEVLGSSIKNPLNLTKGVTERLLTVKPSING